MDPRSDGSPGVALVSRILTASGVLFLLAGAFIVLFVNITVGAVLVLVGVLDLATAVSLPWLTNRQQDQ